MNPDESTFQNGALIDTRPEAARLKDYLLKETVVSVNPVVWTEKPRESWRKFPIFNQDGSGSCVAQTLAKLLGVMYWIKNQVYVHFSATHIYQQRSNKPASGMAGVDAFEIVRKGGATLEELVPSQNMSDAQMDGIAIPQYKKDVGAVFKVPNYLQDPIKDIDTIASIIQTTGKAVMVWFYFENREWTERPVVMNPALDLYAASTARHSVAAVDFTLYQGKKALIIEDSWGSSYGLAGQRIIDEDWFKARHWFAAHPINFVFDEQQSDVLKPKHTFYTDLVFGMTNAEVVALQDCLKYEGCFPSNIDSSGYYGSITRDSVEKFQVKYGLTKPTDPGYGRCGPLTRGKLNSIYK